MPFPSYTASRTLNVTSAACSPCCAAFVWTICCATSVWTSCSASGSTSACVLPLIKSNIPHVLDSASAAPPSMTQTSATAMAAFIVTLFIAIFSLFFWRPAKVRYTLFLKPLSARPNAFFKSSVSHMTIQPPQTFS
ncbi:hypothetical protein SDC9_180340 [bioreactor metagenome]|uniref:Uncharacterized protein n=1 Tax=bioreactor metagenome TaxID=1076179 RepID=A0A645H1F5_9ZZZZ